jgi:hypothetical protein
MFLVQFEVVSAFGDKMGHPNLLLPKTSVARRPLAVLLLYKQGVEDPLSHL